MSWDHFIRHAFAGIAPACSHPSGERASGSHGSARKKQAMRQRQQARKSGLTCQVQHKRLPAPTKAADADCFSRCAMKRRRLVDYLSGPDASSHKLRIQVANHRNAHNNEHAGSCCQPEQSAFSLFPQCQSSINCHWQYRSQNQYMSHVVQVLVYLSRQYHPEQNHDCRQAEVDCELSFLIGG